MAYPAGNSISEAELQKAEADKASWWTYLPAPHLRGNPVKVTHRRVEHAKGESQLGKICSGRSV
ncbi:Hypothetical predicted protein [Pelobates cultripes]|uniref:Uncharacterized protein n=1 Tax=Pelobates cultripes TaxID=61616 RepID=A0AAD1SR73_PELCU|nr:Hypothetical predicted protein [Pelobates cultripes]